jgi:hypothetical protein
MKMIHFPKTRLSELAARPGGMSRSDAVESAKKQMESMRGDSDNVIETAIDAVEAITYEARKSGKLQKTQLLEILRHGDQMVTLAGTFGYASLGVASRSLCDVADGMLGSGLDNIAPILVHVQAIRMISPRATALAPEEVDKILAELTKILTHFDFVPISAGADKGDFEEAIPFYV